MNDPSREARRWILQALDDLKFVRWVRDEGVFFDKGCFLAQQAAEKALNACLYGLGRRRVIGHSAFEMLEEIAREEPSFARLADEARRLDRLYIPTRYPNGLPGGSPYQTYTLDDLCRAAEDAGAIVENSCGFLEGAGITGPRGDS